MLVHRGDAGFTGNIYAGLHEFEDMGFLLHAVRPDDLFVDVGANVGSYTVLACAARGASGVCFEPVPATYSRLVANVEANGMAGRVETHNLGVSDREGTLAFTSSHDVMNRIIAEGEPRPADAIDVPVTSLDAVLAGREPSVVKIDVEGFELQVLHGAGETLRKPSLHSVILEVGADGAGVLEILRGHGFQICRYNPFERSLTELGGEGVPEGNALFVRDTERIRRLVREASHIRINGVEF